MLFEKSAPLQKGSDDRLWNLTYVIRAGAKVAATDGAAQLGR